MMFCVLMCVHVRHVLCRGCCSQEGRGEEGREEGGGEESTCRQEVILVSDAISCFLHVMCISAGTRRVDQTCVCVCGKCGTSQQHVSRLTMHIRALFPINQTKANHMMISTHAHAAQQKDLLGCRDTCMNSSVRGFVRLRRTACRNERTANTELCCIVLCMHLCSCCARACATGCSSAAAEVRRLCKAAHEAHALVTSCISICVCGVLLSVVPSRDVVSCSSFLRSTPVHRHTTRLGASTHRSSIKHINGCHCHIHRHVSRT